MNKIKKIIKKSVENSLEFVKPLGQLGSADSVASQLLGKPQKTQIGDIESKGGNEVSNYLKNVGDPNINPEEVKKKDAEKVSSKIQDYRKSLQLNDSMVSHLRIPNLAEYRKAKKGIYYEILEEKEEAERQKKAATAQTPLVVPTSKATRGGSRSKITKESSSFESNRNRKTQ